MDDAEIHAAIVANPPPGSLDDLPGLRLIQSLWAGVDRLLADATLPPGVPIARMVDPAMNEAMAETALWATLALHRGFFGYALQQRAGEWRQQPQRRADEVPVLVLGLGQMGRAVARRLLDVFAHEPLAADHPYWQHPRVVVLPHVAALTDARSASAVVARNIEALASGAPLANLVARDAGY